MISGDGGAVALQVGDDDSHGVEYDQLRGDLMQELELKRECPALPAHFVCHLHSHQVKIGRGAVRLLRVGLNPQNDAGDLQFTPRPPVSDALFPVRRQEGGITTGVALHNLESSPGLLLCDLMREGVLLDAASIPLEANGQTSWLIDQAFPAADTSDFVGSVRCDAVGEGLFSAVALEMDPGNRIFTTLPVVPVPEMPDQE